MAQAFATLGQITEAMAEKQKPIDAAKHVADYNIAVNDLKAEVQTVRDPMTNQVAGASDPLTWRNEFQVREAKLREGMLKAIPDERVKSAVGLQIARMYDNHINDISGKGILASHEKSRADLEQNGVTFAALAINAKDDRERSQLRNAYNASVMAATVPATVGGHVIPSTLKPGEDQKLIRKFDEAVMVGKARGQIRAGDFAGAEATLNTFGFPDDKIDTLYTHMNAIYDRNTAAMDKVKKDAYAQNLTPLLLGARSREASPEAIDQAYARGEISEDGWKTAIATRKAAGRAGEITESDPATYKRLFTAVHQLDLKDYSGINNAASTGLLSDGDWQHLTQSVEANIRRKQDGGDEMERKLNADPYYKSAKSYITTVIPVHDQLNADQKFRRAEAVKTFEDIARGVDAHGKPTVPTKDLPGLAETIVEHSLDPTEREGMWSSKLMQGVDTKDLQKGAAQIATMRQQNLLTREQAANQLYYLNKVRELRAARPPVAGSAADRGKALAPAR